MTNTTAHLRRAGDSAWLVDFGERTDDAVNNAAIAFDRWLTDQAIEGVVETAPTIRSVLVRFDPLALDGETLAERLRAGLAERDWLQASPPAGRRRWRLPVVYGGEHGPHLAEIAHQRGVDEATLVAAHSARAHRVRMVGFAPGFVYTGMLDAAWDLPRRSEVVARVPPGTIAVAVRQTVLTSTTIPTGWRLIGRTPWRAFALDREPPFALAAGDELVFEPIAAADYDRLAADAEAGRDIVTAEPVA
ncbi:MAG: 5-oxoprolinase subunit B family protein [Alphaproteobacteria bacterium]